MGWTGYQFFLSILLVSTGSLNTLSAKWADELESEARDGSMRKFHHPYMQACMMFFGEILCLATFFITMAILKKRGGEDTVDEFWMTRGNHKFNPLLLIAPAMCDMIGTTMMYVGLTMTYASSFQMFRGSVIVFVGLFSMIFLKHQLKKQQWIGILLIVFGLIIVGIADFTSSNEKEEKDSMSIVIGDVLIICAQLILATQFVIEEKYVSGEDIPALAAVGWEGVFGFSVESLLCIPFYFIWVGKFGSNPREVIEDVYDGLVQISNNYLLIIACSGIIISIAFFNFAGISVTKELSATTRMVLDSVRTLVIWIFSLIFLGQSFQWLQLMGFLQLICGMFLYNEISWQSVMRKRYQQKHNIDPADDVSDF